MLGTSTEESERIERESEKVGVGGRDYMRGNSSRMSKVGSRGAKIA